MQKIMGILEKPLGKFSAFIQNNNFTSAIVRGITISIPVTIVGGLATLITAAPDPAILGEGNFFYGVLALWQSLAQGSLGTFAALVNNVTIICFPSTACLRSLTIWPILTSWTK